MKKYHFTLFIAGTSASCALFGNPVWLMVAGAWICCAIAERSADKYYTTLREHLERENAFLERPQSAIRNPQS